MIAPSLLCWHSDYIFRRSLFFWSVAADPVSALLLASKPQQPPPFLFSPPAVASDEASRNAAPSDGEWDEAGKRV